MYGSDVKSDVKTSPNGNGYRNYDDDDGDPKRSMNGIVNMEKLMKKRSLF